MIDSETLERILTSALPNEVEVLGPDSTKKVIHALLDGTPVASQFRSSNAPGHMVILEVINTVAAVGSFVCAAVPIIRSSKLSRDQILTRLDTMTGAKPLTAKQRERVADALLSGD